MRRTNIIAFAWIFFFAALAQAARETIVLEEPQRAQEVEGVVLDPAGEPIPDMKVTDCAKGWGTALRSTTTDSKGQFRFTRQRGKSVYYLSFEHPMFNPLRLKLKLDKKAPTRGITATPHIGG